MRERPILFSGPMVRAILAGTKTQTRREVKITHHTPGLAACLLPPVGEPRPRTAAELCPYGQPGDRLWVRESTHRRPMLNLLTGQPLDEKYDGGAYSADNTDILTPEGFDLAWWYSRKACPSIHMPRWASRITMEITGVRVERLQAGDGEAAFESRYLPEGINSIHHGDGEHYYSAFRVEPNAQNWADPFDAWRELWVSVNGTESWAANPWVWVVEFRRIAEHGAAWKQN